MEVSSIGSTVSRSCIHARSWLTWDFMKAAWPVANDKYSANGTGAGSSKKWSYGEGYERIRQGVDHIDVYRYGVGSEISFRFVVTRTLGCINEI
ncbi:hypothetical protein Tco_0802279 [Tanacetum coccineum]|uniref:Uncharacterized protein n=1 Tax=Tanacetum coccineum TaxID=301880 RepID=A0ABQ5A145_9ASTR